MPLARRSQAPVVCLEAAVCPRRTELRSRLYATGPLRVQLIELDDPRSDAARIYDDFVSLSKASEAATPTRRELAFAAGSHSPVM